MQTTLTTTERTQVKRLKDRASYDKEKIYAVIDEAMFATIAFHDGVNTHAIPTAAWREEDNLYVHGSNGSRLIKFLETDADVCVSMTNIHGLVLARSAVQHGMNYSSVCIYGSFERVEESMKKFHMQQFMEHWMPGRWQYVRQPDKNELAATTIMRISIKEAVMKSRQGPPKDKEKDMQHPVWAGVLSMKLEWQQFQQVVEQNGTDLPGLFYTT